MRIDFDRLERLHSQLGEALSNPILREPGVNAAVKRYRQAFWGHVFGDGTSLDQVHEAGRRLDEAVEQAEAKA